MHKIYSRPRLKIPKVVIHMKNNKERSGKRAKILIIVVVKIQEEIDDQGRDDIEIALRKFYWIKINVW